MAEDRKEQRQRLREIGRSAHAAYLQRLAEAATGVHQCRYGDTNGDGDCPHGFTEFEVVPRG